MSSDAPAPTPPDDEKQRRQDETDALNMLRALRQVAQQARADRHRQTFWIVSTITATFIIRQVLPPAWTVWFPL